MLLSIVLQSLHTVIMLTVSDAAELSINDLSNYLDDSIAQFRLNVHKKLQQNKRRVKRGLHINDFLQLEKNNSMKFILTICLNLFFFFFCFSYIYNAYKNF